MNVSIPTAFMYSLPISHEFLQHGNDKEGADTLTGQLRGMCVAVAAAFLNTWIFLLGKFNVLV